VTSGTLAINGAGSINNTSSITLNGATAAFMQNSSVASDRAFTLTAGTLGGTGTINTAITAGTGVTLAPGDRTLVSPAKGTLTFANNVTVSTGSVDVRLFSGNGTNNDSDKLVQSTTGTLTFGGTLNVTSDLSGANALTNTSWANAGTVTVTGSNNLTISGDNIGSTATGTLNNNLSGGAILRLTGTNWGIARDTSSFTSTVGGSGVTIIDSNISSYGNSSFGTGSTGVNNFTVGGTGSVTLNGGLNLTSTGGTGGLFTVNNAGGSFTQSASSVISGSTAFTLTIFATTLRSIACAYNFCESFDKWLSNI
jgi:hypothetical protein